MAKLTQLRALRVEPIGRPWHSVLSSRGSWKKYFQLLAPVHPHLNRLEFVCGRARGDDWTDEVDEPTCFDRSATLEQLELLNEAHDFSRSLPKILPSSLERLHLHTVSEDVLARLIGLLRHGWEFRASRQLTLDTVARGRSMKIIACIRCIVSTCTPFVPWI
jgi:hypothetical protein